VSRTDAREADAAALVPVGAGGGVGGLLLACHGQQIWRQRSQDRGARLGFRGFGGKVERRENGAGKNWGITRCEGGKGRAWSCGAAANCERTGKGITNSGGPPAAAASLRLFLGWQRGIDNLLQICSIPG
jgi:hypothetical protein